MLGTSDSGAGAVKQNQLKDFTGPWALFTAQLHKSTRDRKKERELEMGCWLCCCILGILAAPCWSVRQCLDGISMNVILLQDEESPWSLNFVKKEILKAIETDSSINSAEGNKMHNT